MRYFLVKFQGDYADEFDVYGFRIMDGPQHEEFINDLSNVEWPTEVWFGTNEAVTFESFEDYEQSITVTEIDEKEVKVLTKLFGGGWGSFLDPGEY